MATFPLSGSSVPARIRSKVDLPEPFGPIKPIRSPSDPVNDTSWKSGCAPKDFEIFWALIIGGNGGLLLVLTDERYRCWARRMHVTKPPMWIAVGRSGLHQFGLDLLQFAVQLRDAELPDLSRLDCIGLRGLRNRAAFPAGGEHRAQRCQVGLRTRRVFR